MGAEVKFDKKEWDKILKRLAKKWGDILVGTSKVRREFSGITSVIVYRDIIDHFKKESGPDGKWKKWSDSYEDHLKKIGRSSNKILQFSGRLRQSVAPQNLRNTNEGVLFFNNAKTKKGFSYAEAHDDGMDNRPPQRKFMWISDKSMNEIVKQTTSWLAEGNN